MKRKILILTLSFFSITVIFTQTPDIKLSDLESQFDKMGEDLSSAVASSATTGLIWSDAYVGNLPHFGVGIFSGVQIIPVDAFTEVLNVVDTGATLPSQLTNLGVPVTSFGLDARLGGFILPFDIGVKFSAIPDLDLDKVGINYLLVGGDLRYALLEGNAVLPKISLGVGYSYLKNEITINGILDGNYDILNIGGNSLALKNPDLVYGWESGVVEFKAQVSKSLLILTPYIGANAGYATTKIGGGVKTAVLKNGSEATQEEIDQLVEAARTAGQTVPDIDAAGFTTYSTTNAWTVKVFGGTSINLALVKIDLSANYDLLGKTYGGQLGFRFQL